MPFAQPLPDLASRHLPTPFYPSTESLPSIFTTASTSSTKMAGMHKMIMPRCAICGKSPSTSKDGECPHEGERLLQSLFQAQMRWIETWWPAIKDWVTNESVKHVTSMFETYRIHRLVSCRATARSLPYFTIYSQYHGQPPPSLVPPPSLAQLRAQLTDLDTQLQSQIDEDWKTCARMYPQVLDYFFAQISVSTPNAPIGRDGETHQPSYSPPRPSGFPTSPINPNSPELESAVTGAPHPVIVEDTPLSEIPGGYYTNTGLSAHNKSYRSRRQSLSGPPMFSLPAINNGQQHVPPPPPPPHPPTIMSQSTAYATVAPHPTPSQRRSRRWSAAAVQEAYAQHGGLPPSADPYSKAAAVAYQAQVHAYAGGVSLQPGEHMNGNPANGGVRISPPRDSSRRRSSVVHPSPSRHRLSAHFADEVDVNVLQQQKQQHYQQQPSLTSKNGTHKGSRRPSLPSTANFYAQANGGMGGMMVPPSSTAASSSKHARHASYYHHQQPMAVAAGRQ